jgi:hypothetical protein
VVATEEREVARKPMVSVKLDPEVYRQVKMLAAWKGQDVGEYLTDLVRPVAQREFRKMLKAASEAQEEAE